MLFYGIVTRIYIIAVTIAISIIVDTGINTLLFLAFIFYPLTTTYSGGRGRADGSMGADRNRPHSREQALYTEYLHLTYT